MERHFCGGKCRSIAVPSRRVNGLDRSCVTAKIATKKNKKNKKKNNLNYPNRSSNSHQIWCRPDSVDILFCCRRPKSKIYSDAGGDETAFNDASWYI